MNSIKKKINRFKKFYPYDNCPLRLKALGILRVMLIKLFPRVFYPNVSLIKYMKDLYNIGSNHDFLVGYHNSSTGFDELWNSNPRDTKKAVESFYHEQEADVWRQVYLSEYDREKKNYVLRVYDLIHCLFKDKNVKILDYGCGCGVFSHYFYSRGYKNITLADIESGTFDFTKKVFGEKFKYMKIDSDASLKENYDIILIIDVLAHAFNPFDVAQHVIDHLNRRGLLIVFFEKGIHLTHLEKAIRERDKTMNYIYKTCKCIKEDEVFIKK